MDGIAITSEIASEMGASLEYGAKKISHCLNQLDDEQVWWRPSPEMNSIGNLLLHLAGNLRQWIVAGVGDAKDIRERQSEFDESGPISKSELLSRLAAVLEDSITALRTVQPENLLSKKRVQGFDVTRLHAAMNSVTHFQGHVQEIICLTRQQLGSGYEFEWKPSTAEEGA